MAENKKKFRKSDLFGLLFLIIIAIACYMKVQNREQKHDAFNAMMSGFDQQAAPDRDADKLAIYWKKTGEYSPNFLPEDYIPESSDEVCALILMETVDAQRRGEVFPSYEIQYFDLRTQEVVRQTLMIGQYSSTSRGLRYADTPDPEDVTAWIETVHEEMLSAPPDPMSSDEALNFIMEALDLEEQPAPGADKFIGYRMDLGQYTSQYIPEEHMAKTPEEVAVVMFYQPGEAYTVQWYDRYQHKVLGVLRFPSAINISTREYVLKNSDSVAAWIRGDQHLDIVP